VDALDSYWQVFPSLRALFEPRDRPGYSRAKVETQQVKATILKHPEFAAYSGQVGAIFNAWRAAHEPMLKTLRQDAKPKVVISTLSENLLELFAKLPLLNNYDAYQRLMDYWAEAMQDDVYLVSSEGWVEAAKPRAAIDNKEKNIRESPDLKVLKKKYKMDLIPPALIVARYFPTERARVHALEWRIQLRRVMTASRTASSFRRRGTATRTRPVGGYTPRWRFLMSFRTISTGTPLISMLCPLVLTLILRDLEDRIDKAVFVAKHRFDEKTIPNSTPVTQTAIV
jgi:hypothetical protein